MGIQLEQFVESYPRLYHMAYKDSLASITQHGLLSTSALLDLFEIKGEERRRLEACHRPKYVPIDHPTHGRAWLRDQKPMSDRGLTKALKDGITPEQWYQILNKRVFFWTSLERLERLMGAKAYKNDEHLVFEVDTAAMLAQHWAEVELCPINSGCTVPFPHPRGFDAFQKPDDYPYEHWRNKRGRRDAVVEVTVDYSIPRFLDYVCKHEIRSVRSV